ncbi:25865_t:CDS:2 [Gigaspora rosea]|nr:25865_t:CDS:2 [Gigaspora rosea]
MQTKVLNLPKRIKGDIILFIDGWVKIQKNTGLQAVFLPDQKVYFNIFEGYIHCYNKRTGVSRCIFRGSTGYQELSFLMMLIGERAKEEAAIATVKNSKKQVRKLSYPREEVIIECREKKRY